MIAGLANATLTSLTARGPTGRDGTVTWAAPAALADRVVLDAPRAEQLRRIGATVEQATAVLYVPKPSPAAAAKAGDRVAVAVDGSPGRAYVVVAVSDRQKAGGLAHLEIYVKE